jgi:hypothetical protein
MNKQLKSFFLALLLVCTFLFQGFLASALANEIWVAPEKKDPDKAVGNWAVTKDGDTHFSFALPDNMTDFLGAKVVVIGKKDKDITYDLHISVAQNMQRHDAISYSLTDLLETLVKDELLEIDVSSVFPDPLYPGYDYITLHFKADKKGEVRIIGMRFQYDGPPGPQGEQGPQGDQGDQGIQGVKGNKGIQGLKGDTGEQGPQGIQGAKGNTGDQGPKGDTGDTGSQGLKGDTGDTGPQGAKGDTGDKGDQGEQGIQGELGPVNTEPAIYIARMYRSPAYGDNDVHYFGDAREINNTQDGITTWVPNEYSHMRLFFIDRPGLYSIVLKAEPDSYCGLHEGSSIVLRSCNVKGEIDNGVTTIDEMYCGNQWFMYSSDLWEERGAFHFELKEIRKKGILYEDENYQYFGLLAFQLSVIDINGNPICVNSWRGILHIEYKGPIPS